MSDPETHGKRFPTAFRGYAPDAVDEQIAELEGDRRRLSERIVELERERDEMSRELAAARQELESTREALPEIDELHSRLERVRSEYGERTRALELLLAAAAREVADRAGGALRDVATEEPPVGPAQEPEPDRNGSQPLGEAADGARWTFGPELEARAVEEQGPAEARAVEEPEAEGPPGSGPEHEAEPEAQPEVDLEGDEGEVPSEEMEGEVSLDADDTQPIPRVEPDVPGEPLASGDSVPDAGPVQDMVGEDQTEGPTDDEPVRGAWGAPEDDGEDPDAG